MRPGGWTSETSCTTSELALVCSQRRGVDPCTQVQPQQALSSHCQGYSGEGVAPAACSGFGKPIASCVPKGVDSRRCSEQPGRGHHTATKTSMEQALELWSCRHVQLPCFGCGAEPQVRQCYQVGSHNAFRMAFLPLSKCCNIVLPG